MKKSRWKTLEQTWKTDTSPALGTLVTILFLPYGDSEKPSGPLTARSFKCTRLLPLFEHRTKRHDLNSESGTCSFGGTNSSRRTHQLFRRNDESGNTNSFTIIWLQDYDSFNLDFWNSGNPKHVPEALPCSVAWWSQTLPLMPQRHSSTCDAAKTFAE